MILLPLSYLGPLQLYCRFYDSRKVVVELNDTYQKQSYRNRCLIYGANGRLSLNIPVKHEKGKKLKYRDIQIDYATDWRRLHWKGIVSAYNSSPYFEYYKDIFEPYYKKQFNFLTELNIQLHTEVLKILKLPIKPEFTEQFYPVETAVSEVGIAKDYSGDVLDLRALIHPKIDFVDDTGFRNIEYTQVFTEVHGFIPNLSILDLIFNMGPEAGQVLKSSLK
jgi:hypothetical protein